MKQTVNKRTGMFKWESRAELYLYFSTKYALTKSEIDSEIATATKEFKLRKGTAINPKDLWQKVGMSLERKAVQTKSGN